MHHTRPSDTRDGGRAYLVCPGLELRATECFVRGMCALAEAVGAQSLRGIFHDTLLVTVTVTAPSSVHPHL